MGGAVYERNEAVCTSGATDNTQLVLDMLSDRAAAARLLGGKHTPTALRAA